MARYKVVDRSPRFLPISLEAQLMVGSFEHALDVLIDEELELSTFERWYRNDETGAPAYDPAVMLKIVLLAYSKGVVSSRTIERLCRENVVFMAISGDSAPQFTTIAKFVRTLIPAIFIEPLDRQLLGRDINDIPDEDLAWFNRQIMMWPAACAPVTPVTFRFLAPRAVV